MCRKGWRPGRDRFLLTPMIMRYGLLPLSLVLPFAALGACGNSSASSTFGNGSGGSSGGTGGSGSGTILLPDDAGLLEDGASASNCASGVGSFIYVISDANNLYTFDPTQFPATTAFTLVGPVTCDSSGVNSMAIDRSGTAWVNFNSGAIFKMTTSAPVTCTATSFASGQADFTGVLGMGFAANSKGSNDETLFVSDNAGPGGTCTDQTPSSGCSGLGLGTIDVTTMKLTALGAYTSSAAGYNAELTGTGDGLLYGFFTTTPSSYGPIDPTTGATSSPPPTSLPTVSTGEGGYAFSFWGGDFYFYTAPTSTTVVTHLETSTGKTTDSSPLSFTIVGAGVSTCAPTVPPPLK
jgi:hypothetical protein